MLHVLIADDDASIRGLLATILGTSECSVDLVSNGQEAIRAFEDCEYDLVITDLEMPRVDGKVLTRSIRQHNPSVPVVMITGCANPDAMSVELKEAGVSKVIAKPFQVAEILALRTLLAEKPALFEAPAS
ncbi:MAG TPA: response regulator [Terriglobia bacterium]|nr:response regulator [Terriglobia bacterium]